MYFGILPKLSLKTTSFLTKVNHFIFSCKHLSRLLIIGVIYADIHWKCVSVKNLCAKKHFLDMLYWFQCFSFVINIISIQILFNKKVGLHKNVKLPPQTIGNKMKSGCRSVLKCNTPGAKRQLAPKNLWLR